MKKMAEEDTTLKENDETEKGPEKNTESRQEKLDVDFGGSKPGSSPGVEVKKVKSRVKSSSPVDNDGLYRVTFTVTIAQCVPTGTGEEDSDGRASRRKRVMEAPRAQNLYHMEYLLVPDELDNTVRTDLVSFGIAAKIYTERQEPKVIKTWTENEQTWVAWTHCHTITMTEDLLKKLFTHNVELRIWDTRDKVSTRAKMDRPRAFKFPPVKAGEDHTGGVKTLVLKQSKSFEAMQPKRSYIDRPLPSQPRSTFDIDPIQAHIQKEAQERVVATRKSKTNLNPAEIGKEAIPDKMNDYLDKAGHRIYDNTHAPIDGRVSKERSYTRVNQLAGNTQTAAKSAVSGKAKSGSTPDNKSHEKPNSAESSKKKKASPSDGNNSSTPKPISRQKTDVASNPPSSGGSDKGAGKPETGPSNDKNEGQDEPEKAPAQNAAGQPPGTLTSNATADAPPSAGKRRDKKKERDAAAELERLKKFGKCCVTIRMAKFFAGFQTITERLAKPEDTVPDLFLSVSVNKPLLSDEMKKKLNPLVIKVHSATNMPDSPLHYDNLRLKCEPAYVKYNFYGSGDHRSVGRMQDKNIYWDDFNVMLAGAMEPSELRQFLSGPPLEIEVHDRDRLPEKQKLKPTLFGDDLEDEKISNVGTVASKRTLFNPFDGRAKPWDPHGVAKFDLSDLLLGQQVLHLKSPIHNCALPDVLGLRDGGKGDSKVVGIAGAVDGPVDQPLPQGNYIDSGAMMKIKVHVAYPLVSPEEVAAKLDVAATPQCPFARILFKFEYKNVQFLQKIQSLLTEINARALGLEDMPPHVIEAALSTYKLSLDQQKSRDIDIVTGFHVMDSYIHMFVLEGLRDEAIRYIWESLPKSKDDNIEVLYNSDLCFGQRVYGPLDVDVCRIKLHEQLSVIVQQPLLYVRDMVPKPCFDALVKLEQLSKCAKLRDAWRADLFPSAESIISMSREFGVPITADDFEELTPNLPKIQDDAVRHYQVPTTSRVWTPIDHYNDTWLEKVMVREKAGCTINFEEENKGIIRERSNLNKLQRSKTMPVMIKIDGKIGHNYSTQTLNSTEQAKEKLRQLLQQEPDRRFSYCQDYHNSMTVVPVNVEAVRKAEEKAHIEKFRTLKGWTYPGKRTFQESNRHPMRPHTSRILQLKEPWQENLLHGKLKPVLERDRYSWSKRSEDIDVWSKPPPTFGNEPSTIHLAGVKLEDEKQAEQRADLKAWKSKIIVADPRTYFHRLSTDTELTRRGTRASNQIDRIRLARTNDPGGFLCRAGLRQTQKKPKLFMNHFFKLSVLKDPPQKYSLMKPGLAIKDIPPFNVVLNPSVDTEARRAGRPIRPAVDNEFDQKVRGLKPGPWDEFGWNMEKNYVPAYDYEHSKFAETKGHDFNFYHKERSGLHKREATLLTDGEYQTHLFRVPECTQDIRGRTAYILPNIEDFQPSAIQGETLETGLGPSLEAIKESAVVEG